MAKGSFSSGKKNKQIILDAADIPTLIDKRARKDMCGMSIVFM